MKIAITGHTSGIGKSLHEIYPDSIGFSRSTGHDISTVDGRFKIINDSQDCDIFFNNAHLGFSQITLLYQLWNEWQDKDRTIVCISSDASNYNHNEAKPYSIHKRALEDACLQLQHAGKPCKVICVKPGYVDTPRVEMIDAKKMDPSDLACFIKEILEMRRSFWIPIVTLYPR